MGNWQLKRPKLKWYQHALVVWLLFIIAVSYYPFNPSLESLAGPSGDLEKAKTYILYGQRELGFSYLIPAALSGNPEAQHLLAKEFEALMHEDEGLFTRDVCKATFWFDKAARQGYAPAQYAMASSYSSGYGVRINLTKAYMWLRAHERNTGKLTFGALSKDIKERFSQEALETLEVQFSSWDYTTEEPATIYHLPDIFLVSDFIEISFGLYPCGGHRTWLHYL